MREQREWIVDMRAQRVERMRDGRLRDVRRAGGVVKDRSIPTDAQATDAPVGVRRDRTRSMHVDAVRADTRAFALPMHDAIEHTRH
ncbi:hypothetical protein DF160_00685 [Burkholderia anthina]|nr:hypothetical protein DF160_00685 [Burkholderia anthina]